MDIQLVKTANTRMQIKRLPDSLCSNHLSFGKAPDAVNISGDFFSREFAAVPHDVKLGKAQSSDSISPELVIHAGSSLRF